MKKVRNIKKKKNKGRGNDNDDNCEISCGGLIFDLVLFQCVCLFGLFGLFGLWERRINQFEKSGSGRSEKTYKKRSARSRSVGGGDDDH